jgi:hypothetical protein
MVEKFRISYLFIKQSLLSFEFLVLGVGYVFLLFFFNQVIRFGTGDFHTHIEILIKCVRHGYYPVFPIYPLPPAYPFLLWVFAGLSVNSFYNILAAANLLMPVFVILNIVAVRECLKDGLGSLFNPRLALIAAITLCAAAPIYIGGNHFYLGRIAFNIWHNSTYIAMIPFAVVLFWKTPEFIRDPFRNFPLVFVLGFINILIKPSFLFAWIPAVLIWNLPDKGIKSKTFFRIAMVLSGFMILIMIQFFSIYILKTYDNVIATDQPPSRLSSTAIIPALLASFLFPMTFLLLYGRSIDLSQHVRLALLIMTIGIIFPLVFVEEGFRLGHGNFFWTAYAANMMLFVATTENALRIGIKHGFRSLRLYALMFVFGLHVVSGLIYLGRYYLSGSYL